jgi:anti-sigma regulatory factor (Ser/Thr protein kinase)/GNAT superfamily N-acetyltransferase
MQLELTLDNERKHLPSVTAFLHATLQQLPLETVVAAKLEEFVVRAAQDAIDHAYPAGDDGLIKLAIEEQHGKLEIRVRDFGIPQDVDALERELHESRATCANRFGCLAPDVADELHWLAFGPQGKALSVVKWLHEKHIADAATPESLKPFSEEAPLAPPQEYTIRRMRPEEAAQVSQLMYRTYGNSYFNEDVYYPDRVAAQNERGMVLSYVAVGAGGAIAGHYALERDQAGPVAEGGQAVVDPAHRGRGLLDRMKDFSLEEAQRLDLVGWYADAVTVHTLTQKSNTAHGGHLTAVDLAAMPKTEKFGKSDVQPQRVSCLLYFHWLRPPAARTVFIPARHRAIVAEIYERLGCRIEIGAARPPSGHGTLAVSIDAGAALATVSADMIGTDTVRLVRQARRELVERTHVEVVYVELPLDDTATAIVAGELEQDGFGFLGVAPHFSPRGDVLRLGYLVEPLAREPIKTLGEPEGRLVDYALAEQKRLRTAM